MANIRIPIPERETYVPEFTPKHDETIEVRGRDGKGLGFKIGDVLDERRFAIAPNGQCLNERDFDILYKRWASFTCAPDGRIIAIASVNKYFSVDLEPIPNPEEFVNARILNGKIVPITFDDTKVEMPRGYEDRRFSANGEIATEKKASLADRAALTKMEALKELFAEGILSADQFASKVSALVGGSDPVEALAATEKPPGFDTIAPEPEAQSLSAPCGKGGFKHPHNVKQHSKFCSDPACVDARAVVEAA